MTKKQMGRIKRWETLRERIDWRGQPVNAVMFITEIIDVMPEDAGDAMMRFYLEQDTQDKDVLGTPTTEDGRFYQFTQTGRWIASALVAVLSDTDKLVKLAWLIGGKSLLQDIVDTINNS